MSDLKIDVALKDKRRQRERERQKKIGEVDTRKKTDCRREINEYSEVGKAEEIGT